MIYGSVCSGIEAATCAWHPLGWRAAFYSEIEPAPSAVLNHYYPDVPNHGDMNRFKEWPDANVDVLVGGTPCQSFSVAGLRKGLADPRGNLTLVYLAVADQYRPEWLVWENVPGVLSDDGGRTFGTFLGGLGQLGYGFSYRVLDAQYVRVESHARAVPQRRRRVFVVGCLGDWRRAAAVLFERESLSGHPPPRREPGKRAAPTISARTKGGGGLGTDFDLDGGVIASTGDVSHCLNAGGMGRQDYETETLVVGALQSGGTTRGHGVAGVNDQAVAAGHVIAFDTTQITSAGNYSYPRPGDPCHPLAAGAHPPAIAIQERAVCENPNAGPDGAGFRFGSAYTLEARSVPQAVANAMQVRRLTPRECERLQGFDDDYTLVPFKGRIMADGPRYKMLGNSMAVPVMRWIGERIQAVATL